MSDAVTEHHAAEIKSGEEVKNKRDSAIVLPSDPETSSGDTEGESTGEEETGEDEESGEEVKGEAAGEHVAEVKHEEGSAAVETEHEPVVEEKSEEPVAEHGEEKTEENPEEKQEEHPEEKLEEKAGDPEHKGDETTEHLSVNEATKEEDEVDDDSISTTVETGEPIVDVHLKQNAENEGEEKEAKLEDEITEEKVEPETTESHEEEKTDLSEAKEPATAEPEGEEERSEETPKDEERDIEESTTIEQPAAEEEGAKEETEEMEKPSPADIAEEEGELKEAEPELDEPTPTEPKAPLEEEIQETPLSSDQEPEVSTEATTPESSIAPADPAPITTPTTHVPTAPKSTPSPLQIPRAKFRQALNMLIQLLSEAEDDEGVVHLNLNEKESELRKVVRMLGKRLEGLEEMEREVEWSALVGTFEERREKE